MDAKENSARCRYKKDNKLARTNESCKNWGSFWDTSRKFSLEWRRTNSRRKQRRYNRSLARSLLYIGWMQSSGSCDIYAGLRLAAIARSPMLRISRGVRTTSIPRRRARRNEGGRASHRTTSPICELFLRNRPSYRVNVWLNFKWNLCFGPSIPGPM